MGERMENRLRCDRAADRRGPHPNCHESQRTAFRDAGDQSPGGALLEPHWADCFPRQAPCGRELEEPQRAAQPLSGVQPPRHRGRSQPALSNREEYTDLVDVPESNKKKKTKKTRCLWLDSGYIHFARMLTQPTLSFAAQALLAALT